MFCFTDNYQLVTHVVIIFSTKRPHHFSFFTRSPHELKTQANNFKIIL